MVLFELDFIIFSPVFAHIPSLTVKLISEMEKKLKVRKFADLKTTRKTGKSIIKPYDPKTHTEIFKKQFMSRILDLERQLTDAKEEYKKNLDLNANVKNILERKRINHEDRLLTLMSFSTVVSLYSRFLDEREQNAKFNLADPLDDTSKLQESVELIEERNRKLEEMLDDDITQLRNNLEQDRAYLCELKNDNLCRTNNYKYRKLRSKQALIELAKQPSLKLTKIEPIREISSNDVFSNDALSYEVKNMKENALHNEYAQIQEMQKKISEIEKKHNDFLIKSMQDFSPKAEKIAQLRNKLHEVTKISLAYEKNLRETMILAHNYGELRNVTSQARRYDSMTSFIKARIERATNDINERQEKYDENKVMYKKRIKLADKRKKSVANKNAENEELESQMKKRMTEVDILENQLFETEMKINLALKAAQSRNNMSQLKNKYIPDYSQNPRIEEMQKIMQLVAINKDDIQAQ